jgi:4-hydroxythreonine-4-phosphate dehydrogenase
MKPIIGIMLGDATGIGPETVAKLFMEDKVAYCCMPLLVGDVRVLDLGKKIAKVDFPVRIVKAESDIHWDGDAIPMLDLGNLDPSGLTMGKGNIHSGKITGDTLVKCLELLKAKVIDALTFAPLNKGAMKEGGYPFEDEHRLFAHYLDWDQNPFGEVNVMKDIWTTRVTSHVPIAEVSKNITQDRVLQAIHLANSTLAKAGYEKPRLAVAALNPHAGENGSCGREEIDVIAPAVKLAQLEGIHAQGPFSADTLFMNAIGNKAFDGVVTMYHDQGQIAIKLLGFQYCVTVSAGLPYPITTPAQGTAYDIAGKGVASTSALSLALKIAAQMSGWRG